MADDLSTSLRGRALPETRSAILQNVYVSLGIVVILVPATIFGLGIGAAVAVHHGSTLLVSFNALPARVPPTYSSVSYWTPTMNRLAPLVVAIGALCACDGGGGGRAVAVEDSTLHGHPVTEPPVRTAVGQVRSIDVDAATLTVVLAEGRSRERTSRGRSITLQATPRQLAALRVGDVVEFKSRASQPYATLITVDSHAHSDGTKSLGAPKPERGAVPTE